MKSKEHSRLPALFGSVRRYLRPFSPAKWYIKYFPVLPFIAGILIIGLSLFLATIITCNPVSSIAISQMLAHNSFFLGSLATVGIAFKDGLISQEKQDRITNALDGPLYDHIKNQPETKSLPESLDLITTFCENSKKESKEIFKMVIHFEGVYKWNNYAIFFFLFTAVVTSFAAQYLPIIYTKKVSLSATIASVVLFSLQLLYVMYVRWTFRVVLNCAEDPRGMFKSCLDLALQEIGNEAEPSKYTSLISE